MLRARALSNAGLREAAVAHLRWSIERKEDVFDAWQALAQLQQDVLSDQADRDPQRALGMLGDASVATSLLELLAEAAGLRIEAIDILELSLRNLIFRLYEAPDQAFGASPEQVKAAEDAFFEMMSGYTTSGATILTDIEVVPHGLLFWRSQTHLLGGMGFLTLTIIFLPHGVGGVRLFRAESSPGQIITRDKFIARNRDAMVWLWIIYLGLNLLQTLLLVLGDMDLFDALCTAFGTVSTSGYSPYNASIGHYDSAYFDWVIIVFMVLGGVTFMLFYHAARREWRVIRINTELRWYLGLLAFFRRRGWL